MATTTIPDDLKEQLTQFLSERGIHQFFFYGISMSKEDMKRKDNEEDTISARCFCNALRNVAKEGLITIAEKL